MAQTFVGLRHIFVDIAGAPELDRRRSFQHDSTWVKNDND